MRTRPEISELGLNTGKKARLHRILYQYGLRNGTALFLPYDQGLEHGPRDFFANPAAGDPAYIARLAVEGGLQRHRHPDRARGEVLLGLRRRGAADPEAEREDGHPAGRRGAVPGARQRGRRRAAGRGRGRATPCTWERRPPRRTSPSTARSATDAARFGMPLIVWAYPRGSAIEAKGGKDSFYAVDYAARTASELGADVVKVNFPHPEKRTAVPAAYDADFSAGRRSTRWCDRPTAPCCSSPAGSARATRPCSRRHGSRWRPAPRA